MILHSLSVSAYRMVEAPSWSVNHRTASHLNGKSQCPNLLKKRTFPACALTSQNDPKKTFTFRRNENGGSDLEPPPP
jgi:hypothetical protein